MALLGTAYEGIVQAAKSPIIFGLSQEAWKLIPTRIPEKEDVQKAWRMGMIPDRIAKDLIGRHGWQTDHLSLFLSCMAYVPRSEQRMAALEQYERERVEHNKNNIADINRTGLRDQNYIQNMIELFAKAFPSQEKLLELVNRGLMTEPLAELILRSMYDGDLVLPQIILRTRHMIPGPSDLIHFAVKDCFTPEIVQKFGYHKELPTAILPYMKQQGFGGELDIRIPQGATTTEGNEQRTLAQWFDLFWWAHWQLVSVTQAMEMLHRLYETSDFGPSPSYVQGHGFNSQDFALLLKAQDYPEYWRTKLEAISYKPLTRTDVKRMFYIGALDRAGVYHSYRASGYSDENAKALLRFAEMEKTKQFTARGLLSARKEVADFFESGIIDEAEFKESIGRLGFDQAQTNTIVTLEQMRLKNKRVKERMKLIRQGFLNGVINKDQTRQLMTQSSIKPERVNDILSELEFKREIKYKQLAVKQILDLISQQIITPEQGKTRFLNLGYPAVEADLLVELAVRKIKDA